MEFTIDRAELRNALGHTQSVVERKNTIPILANVALRATQGQVRLTATDMDMEVAETVPAQVARKGATTLPALMLFDIVRKMEGGEVHISAKDFQATVRSGRSVFKLACLSNEDFPHLDAGDFPFQFSLPAAGLRDLIDTTRFAVSTEETRYYLNGIYLHEIGSEFRAVATDGHRLARMSCDLPFGAGGMPGIIVPRKTVGEIRKLLDDATADIPVAVSPTRIQVSVGQVTVTSKLIDGTFPDYERVIPAGNDKVLEVDASVLASAVSRVAIVAGDKSRAVKMSVARGLLTLSSHDPNGGSATEEIDVSYVMPRFEIGFNSRYLTDVLGQINGTVRFAMGDPASPTIVTDTSNDTTIFVLMPMRV